MIYLDNAATTKPFLKSLKIFQETNANDFYNPSAPYSASLNLSKKINEVRSGLINFLGGKLNDNIVFTSGATEANNLAVFGSNFYKTKKYLFSSGEHPSVLNCANELKNKGYNVEFIPLQSNGQIDYQKFEKMLDRDVCFVSTILVNNETGAINDIKKIRKLIDEKTLNCVLHVDAVQAFSKIDFSVSDLKIDLCSISAHKIGGIKGVGALYISSKTKIKNINFGGGQEKTLRSGTINSAGILSFFESAKISFKNKNKNYENAKNLKDDLIKKLNCFNNQNQKIKIVSDKDCSPYIVSICFEGHMGETIMRFLDANGIFIGVGSACSSNKVGNRVLENMHLNKTQILGSVRLSFGFENTKEDLFLFNNCLGKYFDEIKG